MLKFIIPIIVALITLDGIAMPAPNGENCQKGFKFSTHRDDQINELLSLAATNNSADATALKLLIDLDLISANSLSLEGQLAFSAKGRGTVLTEAGTPCLVKMEFTLETRNGIKSKKITTTDCAFYQKGEELAKSGKGTITAPQCI